jgi:hypothetical protein
MTQQRKRASTPRSHTSSTRSRRPSPRHSASSTPSPANREPGPGATTNAAPGASLGVAAAWSWPELAAAVWAQRAQRLSAARAKRAFVATDEGITFRRERRGTALALLLHLESHTPDVTVPPPPPQMKPASPRASFASVASQSSVPVVDSRCLAWSDVGRLCSHRQPVA